MLARYAIWVSDASHQDTVQLASWDKRNGDFMRKHLFLALYLPMTWKSRAKEITSHYVLRLDQNGW